MSELKGLRVAVLATDGFEVEVIDPRTLNPLDAGTLLESVRSTGRLCVVHEDTRTMGVTLVVDMPCSIATIAS